MLLASQILLIIAGVLLLVDASLMFARRPNPLPSSKAPWPLPCPIALVFLGLGVILYSIATF
jgi:hypothetical protein